MEPIFTFFIATFTAILTTWLYVQVISPIDTYSRPNQPNEVDPKIEWGRDGF
jgi:hypothetical protein